MSRPRRLPPGVQRIDGPGGSVAYRGRVRRSGQSSSRTFGDPHEAGAWVQDARARLHRGEPVMPPLPPAATSDAATFEEAAVHFFRSAAAGKVLSRRGGPYAPSSLEAHESAVRCHVVPYIGQVPIDGLSRRELQRLFDELASSVSANALLAVKAALDAIFTVAERDDLYEGPSPSDGLKVPRTTVRKRGRVLTRSEQRALLEAAREHDSAAAARYVPADQPPFARHRAADWRGVRSGLRQGCRT